MSSPPLEICLYSTYLTVPATKEGYLVGTHESIHKLCDRLKVPQFDGNGRYTTSIRYYSYNYTDGCFVFPRMVESYLCKYLDRIVEITNGHWTYDLVHVDANPTCSIDLQMKPEWVDKEGQAAHIAHLMDTETTMRTDDAQTGVGKTYIAIKVATLRKKPCIIICDGLLKQWKQNILEKTDTKDEEILIIQGAPAVIKLAVKREQLIGKIKWLIFSTGTLRNYVRKASFPYTELIPFNELLCEYGVGTKIVDEYHLNFNCIVTIDLSCNVEHNIYLSATPKRSDRYEKPVFDFIFPPRILSDKSAYKKYTHCVVYRYRLPGFYDDKAFVTRRGYNHLKYENAVVQRHEAFMTFVRLIGEILKDQYVTYNQYTKGKCLIFVETRILAHRLCDILQKMAQGYKVHTKLGDDPESVFQEADIIIGTLKSCGVGKDIPQLATVINTASLSAESLLEQMFGRLRNIADIQCRYIDVVNISLPSQVRHLRTKRRVYTPRALTYKEKDYV